MALFRTLGEVAKNSQRTTEALDMQPYVFLCVQKINWKYVLGVSYL